MKRYISILFVILGNSLYAQQYKYEVGLHSSVQHYIGDISRKFMLADWAFGGGVDFRYNYNFNLAISSSLSFDNLKGNMKWSDNVFPDTYSYSFNKYLFDLSALCEYNFYPYSDRYKYLDTKRFSPFISLGLGSFFFKDESFVAMPYIQTSVGVKYKISNRFNIVASYQLKYSPFDNMEPNKKFADPFNVKQIIPKGGDAMGKFAVSLTYDIGFRKESNCH